ncbi:pentatricopeptide repeat-containing protein At2g22070-like [Cryptomeria japonica]|uniref:pentatricopeptide repeat-containing protein At2g22070-like n=1 Tax=Cryptomeria japonica TaxID=3369 RepID=UPI0027DA6197|nr:pentatricopeptide repeat-containing protein At2g22070-like [Cryptomeria japonica]
MWIHHPRATHILSWKSHQPHVWNLVKKRTYHSSSSTRECFTYAYLLQACVKEEAWSEGQRIHVRMIKRGVEMDTFLETKLVIMYAKYGKLDFARRLFERGEKNVVGWNAMISGYAQHGQSHAALALFKQMRMQKAVPDHFVLATVVSLCETEMQVGKQLHAHVMAAGFQSDLVLLTALVRMYSACGAMDDARQLFDKMSRRDVISWTVMIAGYTKCGRMEDAFSLFGRMPRRDAASWNAMIAGCAQNGYGAASFTLFCTMQRSGCAARPNQGTYAALLIACAGLSALDQGKQVHAHIIKSQFWSDALLRNALVDMYAKSGSIQDSRLLFDGSFDRDVIRWTTMIAGYGKHGFAAEAIHLFDQMQKAGVKPNHITFISILSACSHAGLVEQGWRFFHSMTKDYNIVPRAEDYACMVDLLGRAGKVEEAHNLINKIPTEPGAHVWAALLGACRAHGNMEVGKVAAQRLFELNPQQAGTYVELSNIYAASGMWDHVAQLRKTMEDRGIRKQPGYSWIVVEKCTHVFVVGDRSHPQTEAIYTMLENLTRRMKEAGYIPDTDLVLHDLEEEEKEGILSHHSEKLAIAFGLISTHPREPIQIVKNLRMCIDCHTATKFISKVSERKLVVRDVNRFHHFREGLCSCGDYW